jgi:alpha-amylase
MSYTGGYVGNVDGILNYPFFFQIRDIIFNSKDMYGIRNYYNDWAKNIDANKLNYMANFVDNHDNARTMSWSGDYATKVKHYKTTHVMALTSVGIPIVYYGAEQLFVGGNDPHNR